MIWRMPSSRPHQRTHARVSGCHAGLVNPTATKPQAQSREGSLEPFSHAVSYTVHVSLSTSLDGRHLQPPSTYGRQRLSLGFFFGADGGFCVLDEAEGHGRHHVPIGYFPIWHHCRHTCDIEILSSYSTNRAIQCLSVTSFRICTAHKTRVCACP